MKKHIYFFLLISYQIVSSQAIRKYSNEFLNIGVDAAAFGMSKSVVATTNNVNAIYWNPAGMANITETQGALMHTEQFAGIGNYDYAAVAFAPKDKNGTVIGFSLIRFGVDNILNTTALIDGNGNIDRNRIRLFSAADYALSFGVGTQIGNIPNLTGGINAKIIRRIIGDFASSWGFGIDAGAQYKLGTWQFGLQVRDITTSFNIWKIDQANFETIKNAIPNQNQDIPEKIEITLPKVQFGIAKNFQLKNNNYNLLSEVDLHVRFTQTNDIVSNKSLSMTPSLGMQLNYKKFVFLRAGVGNFQNIQQVDDSNNVSMEPNIGLGFAYKGIQLDYALSNIASAGNALYSNTFSIKMDFNLFKH